MVSGSLVPRDEILVAPEVEGFRVLELKADEGDRVKKGDVLATLVQEIARRPARPERRLDRARRCRHLQGQQRHRRDRAPSWRKPMPTSSAAKPLKQSGYLSAAPTTSAKLPPRPGRAARRCPRRPQAGASRKGPGRSAAPRIDVAADEHQVTAPADGFDQPAHRAYRRHGVEALPTRCSASSPAARWSSTPR